MKHIDKLAKKGDLTDPTARIEGALALLESVSACLPVLRAAAAQTPPDPDAAEALPRFRLAQAALALSAMRAARVSGDEPAMRAHGRAALAAVEAALPAAADDDQIIALRGVRDLVLKIIPDEAPGGYADVVAVVRDRMNTVLHPDNRPFELYTRSLQKPLLKAMRLLRRAAQERERAISAMIEVIGAGEGGAYDFAALSRAEGDQLKAAKAAYDAVMREKAVRARFASLIAETEAEGRAVDFGALLERAGQEIAQDGDLAPPDHFPSSYTSLIDLRHALEKAQQAAGAPQALVCFHAPKDRKDADAADGCFAYADTLWRDAHPPERLTAVIPTRRLDAGIRDAVALIAPHLRGESVAFALSAGDRLRARNIFGALAAFGPPERPLPLRVEAGGLSAALTEQDIAAAQALDPLVDPASGFDSLSLAREDDPPPFHACLTIEAASKTLTVLEGPRNAEIEARRAALAAAFAPLEFFEALCPEFTAYAGSMNQPGEQ